MLTLESHTQQSAMPKILLAAGFGAIFGFEMWGLAEYALPGVIPFYLSMWIIMSQVFLGVSVGAVRSTEWWRRGIGFGLLYSLPAALCGLTHGGRLALYGAGALAAGAITGLLIACISDDIFPAAIPVDEFPPPNETAPAVRKVRRFTSTVCLRLEEEKACLDHLEAERDRLRDVSFGKATEDRIVWGELLDLELQVIDEQVDRICRDASKEGSHKSKQR